MNEQAREALSRVLRNYGPSICNTPRSCEMFIRQECGAYPDESKALIEALRQGVTADLLTYRPAETAWDPFADLLKTRLQTRSNLKEADGAWAVDTWAKALGRHPETYADAPMVAAAAPTPMASPGQLKIAMTAVVASGGALGAALGANLIPAGLLLTAASAEIPLMSHPVRSSSSSAIWITVILILLLIGAISAVGGAIGAALGWLYGKGDAGHWSAFGTSFGAAFASSALGYWAAGMPGAFFGGLISAFGAATATARRGGFA